VVVDRIPIHRERVEALRTLGEREGLRHLVERCERELLHDRKRRVELSVRADIPHLTPDAGVEVPIPRILSAKPDTAEAVPLAGGARELEAGDPGALPGRREKLEVCPLHHRRGSCLQHLDCWCLFAPKPTGARALYAFEGVPSSLKACIPA
jgi:hypothetical protein